jgi:hypothetical protein
VTSILAVKVRMRRRYILCLVAFVIVCIVGLRLLLEQSDFIIPSTTNKFDNFDNVTGAQKIIVPNVIHFVLFGQNSLEFVSFISILSALKVRSVVLLLFETVYTSNLFVVVINKVGRYWIYVRAHTSEFAFIALVKFLVLRCSAGFLK